MAMEKNWKEKAYDYMENQIQYLIFDTLYYDCDQNNQQQMNEYMFHLETQGRRCYLALENPPLSSCANESGDMFKDEGFINLLDAYLDNLNVDWIINEPNGLEITLNGAKMWINMIAMFYN